MTVLTKYLDYREDKVCGRMSKEKDKRAIQKIEKDMKKQLPENYVCQCQPYFFTNVDGDHISQSIKNLSSEFLTMESPDKIYWSTLVCIYTF